MERKNLPQLGWLALALLVVLMAKSLWDSSRSIEPLPYSAFEQALRDGRIAEVEVGDQFIRGRLKAPEPGGKSVLVATRVEPELAARLESFGVPYARVHEPTWLQDLFSWLAPALVFFGVWMLLARRFAARLGGGSLIGIGQSKAKVYMEKRIGVRFDDVAGVDEAKAELQEVVEFLKNPQAYGRLGARVPKGVLLVGPTGTGKTLLARAVAGEAGVAFFSISGSEFIEMFVGVGAARVRDLFEQARAHAPAIIFIDELDALGKARGFGFAGGHDEREQTLNQLLVELDGFDPSVGVVLLAATNRPEILDPALLRAGRFDRQVLVDKPDRAGRVAILKVHAKKVKLASDVDLDQVAAITVGFAGADLANLVNEAALVATRRNGEAVTLPDFTQAIERIVAGIEKKNRLLTPQERLTVAYHEMGHALVASAIPGSDPVHKISIIPRGIGALGYTIQRPTDDRYLMTRTELENKMAVLLGGRAAESLIFDHLSTGAADDLAKCTDIARSMATQYGMFPELGHVSYEQPEQRFLGNGMLSPRRVYSESTAREIDAAVRQSVDGAYVRAKEILARNRGLLERGAEQLLANETLDEAQLKALFGEVLRMDGQRNSTPAAAQ